MIDFNNIKTILQLAGITQLKLTFDGEQQIVIAEYIFKGVPGHKQITWEEIIDSLSIGVPDMSLAKRAGCVLDVDDNLA